MDYDRRTYLYFPQYESAMIAPKNGAKNEKTKNMWKMFVALSLSYFWILMKNKTKIAKNKI